LDEATLLDILAAAGATTTTGAQQQAIPMP
jgi:hypothetical protein